MTTTTDSGLTLFLATFVGVLVSLAIPAARKAIGNNRLDGGGIDWRAALSTLWALIRPYIPYAILALAVSVMTYFLMDLKDVRAAFAAGYAWDSTVQKFSGKP